MNVEEGIFFILFEMRDFSLFKRRATLFETPLLFRMAVVIAADICLLLWLNVADDLVSSAFTQVFVQVRKISGKLLIIPMDELIAFLIFRSFFKS